MTDRQHILEPGERFPKEMQAPALSDILTELSKFGIEGAAAIRLIDSTHDAMDVRLNYIIDRKWVLRFCNAPDMTEKRMGDLNRLIDRYRAIGLKCPAFIADNNGQYLHSWKQLLCYLSEFVDLPLADSIELNNEEGLVLQVAESVARFAETYRDVDLSETMGMYSLFDLSPFDIPHGVDEKQENFRSTDHAPAKQRGNRSGQSVGDPTRRHSPQAQSSLPRTAPLRISGGRELLECSH